MMCSGRHYSLQISIVCLRAPEFSSPLVHLVAVSVWHIITYVIMVPIRDTFEMRLRSDEA